MAASNSYLSSKAQIDSLLSKFEFLQIAEDFVIIDPSSPIYTDIYKAMDDYLQNVNPKFTIEIITSDGYLSYSNKLSQADALKAPNQNTSPEVMASINFVWGNPMINKTTFPIRPIYADYLAPMVSDGYGIADRYHLFTGDNRQFVAKTWAGLKDNTLVVSQDGPTYAAIFTLRVSQNRRL
jgi:hypothetical protein